jgi:pyridoxamine 5'-phosphate oxidase
VDIADLRLDYSLGGLREVDVDPDPIKQFGLWFAQAIDANLPEPTAMTLATCTPEGIPSARVVLLKGVDERGFTFFTSYEGRKARELAVNPRAALVFYWKELERQVRVEGTVERTSVEESDAYFRSRPRGSQLGACASWQSEVIVGRHVLDQRLAELEQQYAGQEVPRPATWGGVRLRPVTIEFWQGRPNRLHDRLRYSRVEPGGWRIERLSP